MKLIEIDAKIHIIQENGDILCRRSGFAWMFGILAAISTINVALIRFIDFEVEIV